MLFNLYNILYKKYQTYKKSFYPIKNIYFINYNENKYNISYKGYGGVLMCLT